MALTKIDDRGLKTPIDLLDNEKIRLGTGNDLEIYHNGTDSFIENSTGYLYVDSGTSAIRFESDSSWANGKMAAFYRNGGVELYYDNSKKLETTTDGVQVTGEVVSGTLHCSGKLDLPDSSGATVGRVLFGDSDDLQIYHDGSNSRVVNSTGALSIQADDININNAANNEQLATFTANGSVELFYDHSKKFETTSSGVKVSDSILEIADATCLIDLMETGSTNHRLRNGSGNFLIQRISDDKGTETTQFDIDGGTGSVSLYHNGTKKLSTTANGICFNGDTAAANALDDYEEGTWSPKLRTIGSSQGEVIGAGTYTKIGNTVTINVQFDNKDVSGIQDGNYIQVSNLPFTANSVPCTSTVPQMYNVSWTGDRVQSFVTAANTSTLEGYESRSGGSWFSWQSGTFRSSGVYLRFNLTYFT